jgi:putative oxidoreductase
MNSLNRYADPVYCIMRLLVGLMFACHGAQKILGWFPDPRHAAAPLDTMGMLSGWIELVGGLLIAFGLLTRIAAFISSGEMAVAFFMVHWPFVFTPIEKIVPRVNGGESAVIYCWVFLFIFFYGAGRWSIDAMIKGGSTAKTSTA